MRDEIWVTLTDEMIAWIDPLAEANARMLWANGAVPGGGQPMDLELWIEEGKRGKRGELAVRRWIGRQPPWHLNVRGPDFSDFIDAKTRRLEHHKLVIKTTCPAQYAYLLVCAAHHPRYRIVGWCWGHEAQVDEHWETRWREPAWYVRDTHPIMKDPEELRMLALQKHAA